MMIIAMNVREALAESLLSFVFFYTACQFWWLWNPSYLLCQRKLFIIQLCPPTSFWYTENPNDTYQVSLTTFICLIIGISQGITLLLFLAGVLHVHTPHSCCYAGLRASQAFSLPPLDFITVAIATAASSWSCGTWLRRYLASSALIWACMWDHISI